MNNDMFIGMNPKKKDLPMLKKIGVNITEEKDIWSPENATRKLLLQSVPIIQEYQSMGQRLSLRQLHYQFVVRQLYENTAKNDDKLGDVTSEARKRGYLPLDLFEDRGRKIETVNFSGNPEQYMENATQYYTLDPWSNQDYSLLFCCEKAALSSVVEAACAKWNVPWAAMRGDGSLSLMYDIAHSFDNVSRDRHLVILYAGDLDPSGWRMHKTLQHRMDKISDHPITVRRVALNCDQVKDMDLLPNPVKEQDSNFDAYVKEVDLPDGVSFELDAISPPILQNIFTDSIEEMIDMDRWQQSMDRQSEMRLSLQRQFKGEGEIGEEVDKRWGLRNPEDNPDEYVETWNQFSKRCKD